MSLSVSITPPTKKGKYFFEKFSRRKQTSDMLRRCLETGWKKIIVNKETLLSLAFLYYNKEIDK